MPRLGEELAHTLALCLSLAFRCIARKNSHAGVGFRAADRSIKVGGHDRAGDRFKGQRFDRVFFAMMYGDGVDVQHAARRARTQQRPYGLDYFRLTLFQYDN